MSRWMIAVFSMLFVLLAGIARADEAGIRQAFAKKFPKVALESVAPTPFAGIYEIVFNGKIAYTDETLSFVMIGNLFDLRGSERRNLTQDRNAEIAAKALLATMCSSLIPFCSKPGRRR